MQRLLEELKGREGIVETEGGRERGRTCDSF